MGEKSCYAYSMEHDTGPAPSNTSTPHPSPQDDLRALAVRLHNGLVFRALCSLVSQLVAGLVYIGAALVMFAGWLRESEATVVRRENLSRMLSPEV